MFAWFMRLFLALCAGALLWNWVPHAVENYRATELGIRGTVTVQGCRGHCHGPFDSDDGTVHVPDVQLVSVGSFYAAASGGRTVAWITDAHSTRGHTKADRHRAYAYAYAYRDLTVTNVASSAPRDHLPPEPYAITLRHKDGRSVKITYAGAAKSILSGVEAHQPAAESRAT